MGDKDKIIEKIKKCFALSKSSNEHEAAAALHHARQLMDKYNISEAEMHIAGVSEAETAASVALKPTRWESELVAVVARAFNCKSYFSGKYSQKGTWNFVGYGVSPQIAEYAFTVLFRQVKDARKSFIDGIHKNTKRGTKTKRADRFCLGWVATVRELVNKFAHSNSEELKAVAAYLDKKHPDLRDLKTIDRRIEKPKHDDFFAGRLAGRDAKLHHGVGSSERHSISGGVK